MPRSATFADWAGLLLLTAFWGTSFMLNEIALEFFSPAGIVTLRTGLAAVVLLACAAARGLRLPPPGRAWLPLAVMALLGNVLPFQLIAWAQTELSSAVTGVLMAVMPLFVLTLSHFFVPGAGLTRARAAGFLFGFVGVVIVIGPSVSTDLGQDASLIAACAALAAALSYAVNSIYARRLGFEDPLAIAAGMMLVAAVCMLPLGGPGLATLAEAPDVAAMIAVAMLGLLATGLATVIYLRIVQGPGPAFLSLVNYLVPVCAVFAGAFLLGEEIAVSVYGGLLLILLGIALSELPAKLGRMRRARLRKRIRARRRLASERARAAQST